MATWSGASWLPSVLIPRIYVYAHITTDYATRGARYETGLLEIGANKTVGVHKWQCVRFRAGRGSTSVVCDTERGGGDTERGRGPRGGGGGQREGGQRERGGAEKETDGHRDREERRQREREGHTQRAGAGGGGGGGRERGTGVGGGGGAEKETDGHRDREGQR